MLNILRMRSWKGLNVSRGISRRYSKDSKEITKVDKSQSLYQIQALRSLEVNTWNERFAIKKNKKKNGVIRSITNAVDLILTLQMLNNFPTSLDSLLQYLKRKIIKKNLIEQMYIPERVAILKEDLAAAHFIIHRRGAIRFVGQTDWIGVKSHHTTLPSIYVPGLHIEAIDAEGTDLYFEGLKNMSGLSNLKWLSLKKLNDVNDWFLDWISNNYYETLEYLDISECKGVTYRGLSCFYRFQQLKTLIVKDVSDTADFKLACIMLQDILPELDIQGIELSVPRKISPVNVQKVKDNNVP